MLNTSALIVTLLVSVGPPQAASEDAFVTGAADSFHALSRIEEAGVVLVPLTDDELADVTDSRIPRKPPPTSSVRRHQLLDTSEVSRTVEDPRAQGPGIGENRSLKVGSGDETRPKTRGQSVAEEPDPGAGVDYELAEITQVPTPRKVPAASPAPRREFPETTGVSRPVDDPSALGIKVERGGEAPLPKNRGRSAVEEEPDPRAVIDWLLKQSGRIR
jgi:hypothetical protein